MGLLKAFLLLLGMIGFGTLAFLFTVLFIPAFPFIPRLRYRMNEFFIQPFSLYARTLVGLKLTIEGDPEGMPRPAVMIGNHQSGLDFALISQACPGGVLIVAKKELARIPLFGWFLWLAGNLLIDRSDRSGSMAMLADGLSRLSRHRLNLAIFPEGTRSKDGEFLPFKKGAFQIAHSGGLPIVPVVCSRLRGKGIWERLELKGGNVVVSILPPVETRGVEASALPELIRGVRERMVEEYRRVNARADELDSSV
jgi:1-acyl-sn-glycerol-3-phosphate acyltransferase